MTSVIKDFFSSGMTPELRDFIRRRLPRKADFDDSFCDWESASGASSGYDSDVILRSVLESTLCIYRGEGAFERDSVVFDKHSYSWPVASALLWTAVSGGGRLAVLDFGGALGSTYFQYRRFLAGLTCLRWGIVEQPLFVEAGRRHLASTPLSFHFDMQECIAELNPTLIHFGSSLQYLPDPWEKLATAGESSAQFLLIDRTPVHNGPDDIFAVQRVPSSIYQADYPVRIFSLASFEHLLMRDWEIVADFEALGGTAWTTSGVSVRWRGWLCVRRSLEGLADGGN